MICVGSAEMMCMCIGEFGVVAHGMHRCQPSRSGRDGTDIKALTQRPARRPFNPLIVPLLHAHRDTPTYCIVTPTMHVSLVGSRGEQWRTERRQQQTVDPEGFYMQYVSTILCFTYTITNQSHTCVT